MSVSAVHVLHAVNCGATSYTVLSDATPQALVEALVEFASGHAEPLFAYVRSARPEIRFTTQQVGVAFNQFGRFGADLSAGNTDLLYRAVTDLGTRDALAATTGIRLRMANAFGFIESVRAGHRDTASCAVRIVAPYDGVNAPIVAAGSIAVTTAPAAAEFYGLGPVSINAASVPGVQEMTLELAPDLLMAGDASELYDTLAAIRTITPVMTLRGLDLARWTTYGLTGTALTALTAYLRRKDSDGGNVADGTTTHASITATKGIILLDQTSGGGNTEAQTALRLQLRSADDTTASVALNQNVAIT